MPPGTSENLHYHQTAQQFFFILKGEATFEVEKEMYNVREGQGFLIPPIKKLLILNRTDRPAEFTVASEPKSHGDRIDL